MQHASTGLSPVSKSCAKGYVEHQIIESTEAIGLCEKSERKALLGLLNKRNECAHPSDFYPGLNESLGYFSELLKRIETLRKKTL